MEVTKVKYWHKTVQNEVVDHVVICHENDGTITSIHSNSTAAPEFYKAMEDFSIPFAAACNLPDELIEKISVREINIKIGEDKEGEDNTHYSIIASLKSGTTVTEIRATVQHKYIPECFEDSILEIVAQAERYIKGERAQVELDLPTTPESSDVENEEDEQNE